MATLQCCESRDRDEHKLDNISLVESKYEGLTSAPKPSGPGQWAAVKVVVCWFESESVAIAGSLHTRYPFVLNYRSTGFAEATLLIDRQCNK